MAGGASQSQKAIIHLWKGLGEWEGYFQHCHAIPGLPKEEELFEKRSF